MQRTYSRRTFLKLAALGLAVPFVAGWREAPAPDPARPALDTAPAPALGRITVWRTYYRETAAPDGKVLGTCDFDDVVTISGAVEGEGIYSHNKVWYQTANGLVYSSFVQPVANVPQQPDWNMPEQGFWVEVTVPFTAARSRPSLSAWRPYKLYYSTVYRAMSVQAGQEEGTVWYGLAEWTSNTPSFYAQAQDLRRIPEADLAPLSPGADKLIKVHLAEQTLEAIENGQVVMTARIASGTTFYINGEWQDYRTPTGTFHVIRKATASHMKGGTLGKSDYYDLPGVPYCTYLTASGVAIHGTYWHNDYGHPRSHGCVNVLPEVARWVYRWSEPPLPYDSRSLSVSSGGTTIEVA